MHANRHAHIETYTHSCTHAQTHTHTQTIFNTPLLRTEHLYLPATTPGLREMWSSLAGTKANLANLILLKDCSLMIMVMFYVEIKPRIWNTIMSFSSEVGGEGA